MVVDRTSPTYPSRSSPWTNSIAGAWCGGDELSMVRDLDRHNDHVDVWSGHYLFVVREHRADPEHFGCRPRGCFAVRAECPDLVAGQSAERRDVGGRGPA